MATQVDEQKCYRLRYEAAERRYDRMKGEMNMAIERQKQLELQSVVCNHADITTDASLRAELAVAKQRIIALELECNRLNSNERLFENEERVRECEDVFDEILGRRHEETDGLHSKHHPATLCKNEACQNYARRMRSVFRQTVAEACAKERNERVNGYFHRKVEPLEKLRAEKDNEILKLRMMLHGGGEEFQAYTVNAEMEAKVCRLNGHLLLSFVTSCFSAPPPQRPPKPDRVG
jgi:hypothetical protein